MIAEWIGGPYDGRIDQLPDGTHTVMVPVPRAYSSMIEDGMEVPVDYIRAECPIICDPNHFNTYLIMWQEPHP